MLRTCISLAAYVAALVAPAPAAAQDMPFDSYLQLLIARARAEGVSDTTLRRMTDGLTPNDRVIALDRAQPGSGSGTGYPPLAPYLATHVDNARIAGGRSAMSRYAGTLAALEARYGVPAEIMVAIWGHETAYGQVKGGFDLSRALATLAWEGRRRQLFADEFVALMKVADKGYSRDTLVGSWAGAFGNPQFLPSVYLRLAADGDGDGRADIMNNGADGLASIANYFRDAGWRRGQPWGVRAAIPAGVSPNRFRSPLASPVCGRVHERHGRYRTIEEWGADGVRPLAPLPAGTLVSLFQPDGPGTPAWLLTSNYRVILEYNCSNYYAMSVGLLADAVRR